MTAVLHLYTTETVVLHMYVSPLNVQKAQPKSAARSLGFSNNGGGDDSSGGGGSSLTRSKCNTSSFEWREKCFENDAVPSIEAHVQWWNQP